MHFKRIELHGFKSFAEPVTIEFHRGITCVIGPNGSGKSNISDAIRWVLGEQSPKMLRGGKMEEVIFSGTASRRSRGMAEVTLVIDNSEGELPIDYNEVAITRRMFRSGESEYSINNNQCRLRDIRELIMDTGIGVDGYSLIGQGKISDIVSNKPESRREIFEEAAGIVMYRSRKAESERKLASTEANLDRVNDIISELEGRIGTLKEDSIKAKEYLELRDRHKELEINLTLNNIEDLELKNEYLKDDIIELKVKLDDSRNRKENVDRELLDCRQKNQNLQQQLDDTREKLMSVSNEVQEIAGREKLYEQRIEAIESSRAELTEEIRILEEKQEKEARNAEEIYRVRAEAEREMEDTSHVLQEKIRQHAALTEAMSSGAEQADRYKEEMFRLHSKISSYKAEISSLENLQETLLQRKKQITEEKTDSEYENRDTLDALSRLRNEKQSLEELLKQSRSDAEEQRQLLEADLREEQRLTKEMEDLRISMGQLSARKKTIEEMESNYEGYNYAVRFIMKAGLPGIFGTVAELISVPEGFEVAIETALGASMQNIVCQDDRSAQNAIVKLKENKAGRLTFLPVSSIRGGRSSYEGKLESESGFQGFGTDCVNFDSKYRSAMEYLLGRVVIVDNMDNAVRLSRKANGLRFVTLEGEIINAGGAITGGKYKNRTANLLERKAEITRLANQLTESKAKKNADMQQLEKLQQDIGEIRDRNTLTLQRNREIEMELLEKRNELLMTEKILNDYKETSGKWEKELDHIQTQQETAGKMIRELEEKINSSQASIRETESLAEQLMDTYDEKKVMADELSEAITSARIAATSCETRKTNADDLARRIQTSLAELEADHRSKSRRYYELELEQKELESGQRMMSTQLQEKEEQKENLQTYLTELAEERTSSAADINRLTSEKEILDKEVGALQDQKYELEIRQAKNETQLDTYKEKLWEDFEVSYIQAMEFKKDDFDVVSAGRENRQLKSRIKQLGEVNVGAIAEYETVSERYEFLTGQRTDILEASDSLKRIIEDMDKTIRTRFKESFDQIVVQFEEIFAQLFGGGHAELRLDDESNPLESGIEIIAQPPGKKLQNINLLSGGEKTMTAIALMFAVLKTKPTPFCILDEVEAALDDANIERFAKYLKTFDNIQFTLVTHQKATMEHADVLYGVTMPEQGISKVLSLNMGDDFEI